MANSMWNLRTSGQEAEIQQTVLAHVVEQIVAEPVAEQIVAEPVAKQIVAEPVVEQVVAEPVVEQVVAVIVEPVVEVQESNTVTAEVAVTWSSTWTRAQLMKHATSLGLPVTLSSTKNEIIEALTRASG